MARVTLEIGGQRWPVACRDGEEAEVLRLGEMLAARWEPAQRAAGDAGTARVMLLIALMLADELSDLQGKASALEQRAAALQERAAALEEQAAAAPAPAPAPVGDAAALASDEAALHRLADRLEALAAALERP